MADLLCERKDSALILTLNRPQVMNALSSELAAALQEAVEKAHDDNGVRTIILTGAGDRAFCAGMDLKQRSTLTPDQKWVQSRAGWHLYQSLMNSPKAVIAAIGGWCLGGGFELALACDLRYAATDARFGWPEMTLGAYPGGGAAVFLPRLVGRARAKELFFTARRVGAEEALGLGIVQHVVGRAELMDYVLGVAHDIEATSPLGLAAVKRSVNEGSDLSMDEAAALDQRLRRPLEGTHDYEEGIRAHFEKRKPVFKGE
jgi:enoyl-CoA hydratase/carnithine racemase